MGIASIAGISVGVTIALILIGSATIMWHKNWKRRNAIQNTSFQIEYHSQVK